MCDYSVACMNVGEVRGAELLISQPDTVVTHNIAAPPNYTYQVGVYTRKSVCVRVRARLCACVCVIVYIWTGRQSDRHT